MGNVMSNLSYNAGAIDPDSIDEKYANVQAYSFPEGSEERKLAFIKQNYSGYAPGEKNNPYTSVDTGDLGSEAANVAANKSATGTTTGTTDQGITADDAFEDQLYTDAQGNKSISQDLYDQAKYDFFKDQGKIPEDASLDEFKSGKFAGATYSPLSMELQQRFLQIQKLLIHKWEVAQTFHKLHHYLKLKKLHHQFKLKLMIKIF
jgi:hypothetical protein